MYPYHVEEASSGQMAINLITETLKKECNCKNRTFKLIFMDIQMPEMEGTVATEKILKLFREDKEKFINKMKGNENQINYE